MDKFLNMLENHIGFCTEVHKKKENLAVESFPQTPFGEWFSGKKESSAKNHSMLPKDLLVSKDGVKVDVLIPSRMAECLQIALTCSKRASRRFRKWNLIPTMVYLCSSINTKKNLSHEKNIVVLDLDK